MGPGNEQGGSAVVSAGDEEPWQFDGVRNSSRKAQVQRCTESSKRQSFFQRNRWRWAEWGEVEGWAPGTPKVTEGGVLGGVLGAKRVQ